MKLTKLLLLLVLLPSAILAQDNFKTGSFIIKGHVKNYKEPTFDFGMTSYLDNFVNSVVVKPDGSFDQQFPIQHRQNIFLYLNDDAITFSISEKDTIYLEWDENDFKTSFSIKGKNPVRSEELNSQLKLYNRFRKPLMDLYEYFYENRNGLTPEKKYTLINELYNRHIQAVIDSAGIISGYSSDHIIGSIYYTYSKFLYDQRLIPQYSLKLKIDTSRTYTKFEMPGVSYDYTLLNEEWFWNVPEYRDFIFDYIRFYKPFNQYRGSSTAVSKPFNPTLDEFHLAQSNIYYTNIKDWFITKSIMLGFGFYSFTDVEKVYEQFIKTCTSPYLKDTLQKYYTATKRLKPGNPAPAFSLKNDKGQTVSLIDFKGKVVYIDFWGVGCGPCIYDIKNYVPDLHKKYKGKEVVFINICVDAKEKEWKEALAKYQLDGINLIAEGWTNNPVCKVYNVSGIPHYILIDKNGKISDNNAPRASELNHNGNKNPIDLLLK